jgi:tetratricopeptide (TPR) repeat protein
MTFTIVCQCGCRLQVEDTEAGTVRACRLCRRQLVVPSLTALREAAQGVPLAALEVGESESSARSPEATESPAEPPPREFICLWTPEHLCRQRVNAQALSSYVTAVQRAMGKYFQDVAANCVVDVGCALSPEGQLALDIQVQPAVLTTAQIAGLRRHLEQLACPPVHRRPVVFSVRTTLGAGAGAAIAGFSPPFTRREEHRQLGLLEDLFLSRFEHRGDEESEAGSGAGPAVSPRPARPPRPLRDWWARLKRILFPQPPTSPRAAPPPIREASPDDQPYALKSASDFTLDELTGLIGRYPRYPRFYRWRAEHYLRQNNFEAAIADLTELLRLRPEDLQALITRGAVCCEAGRMQQGLADFNAVLRRDPDNVAARYSRGLIYLDLEAWEAAGADFGHAAQVDPWDPRLRLAQGKALLMLRRHREAFDAFSTTIRLDPHDDQAYALRGAMRQSLPPEPGAVAAAIADFTRAIELNPEQPFHYLRRAERYWMNDQFAQVITDCDRVLELDPESAVARGLRGVAHESLDHADEAIADCTAAIDKDQGNFFIHLARANAYAKRGEYELALADAEEALRLEPERADAYNGRGMARAGLQRLEEALEDFDRAIKLAPEWPTPYGNRAVVYRMLEQPERAVDDLTQVLRLEPAHAQAYRLRAQCWFAQKQPTKALADLNEAVRLAPEDADVYFERASFLFGQEQFEQARGDLDRAITYRPDFAPALFYRGQIRASQHDWFGALRDLNEVIRLLPDFSPAFCVRGDIWAQQGELEKAEADYQAAIELNPESATAVQQQQLLSEARFHHHQERFDQAIQLATEALDLDEECLPAYAVRAAAYWYSEQFVEALADCDRAMEAGDDTASVYSRRGQLLAELGEFEAALQDLDRAVTLAQQAGAHVVLAYTLDGRALTHAGLGHADAAERDFRDSVAGCPENAWVYYNQGLVYHQQGEDAQAAVCFRLALTLDNPRLPPRKRDRARAFVARHTPSAAQE